MLGRIKTVLKNGRPFAVLTSGLLVVAFITASLGVWHHRQEVAFSAQEESGEIDKQPVEASMTSDTKKKSVDESSAENEQANPQHSQPVRANGSGPAQVQARQNSTSPPNASSPAGESRTKPSHVTAALTVQGSSKGTVTLPAGSNHCDVLKQALKGGLISNLDMRYNAQYGTYGVYVIDGIGETGAVWWTYKVNGTSPPYGCSQTPVRNGDTAAWHYVKG